jgi:hypothetical protein
LPPRFFGRPICEVGGLTYDANAVLSARAYAAEPETRSRVEVGGILNL